MNKKIFKITSIQDSDDYSFWKDKSYLIRIGDLEKLRRIIFGYDPSTQRLQRVLKITKLKKIKYLVVGGYAVALHGYPRATGDIDIWIAISLDNARKTTKVLQEFGFDAPELKENLFLEKEKNIRMGIPPLRIEILTSIDGVTFSSCYKNKTTILIDGLKVNFISLKDLKTNKKISGRYRDLDDLEHLKKIIK